MRKLFYGLGAVAAVVTPVVAVVSCGSSSEATTSASYDAKTTTITVKFEGTATAAKLTTALSTISLADLKAAKSVALTAGEKTQTVAIDASASADVAAAVNAIHTLVKTATGTATTDGFAECFEK